MNEKSLFNGPFRIIKTGEVGGLTFAKIFFDGEEITIRFKLNNLEFIIEYIQRRYRRQGKLINPVAGFKEEWPLKQHLKDPNCDLFYR